MKIHFDRNVAIAVLSCAALLVAASALLADSPQYSGWSAPVNLGPVLNSSSNDAGAFLSKDGLSLYFGSTRPGGLGGFDIWVSRRDTVHDAWSAPQNLGSPVNTANNEQTPALSLDNHTLYFARDGANGFGGLDLYVSRRPNKRDDFGWRTPENLGSLVNSSLADYGPSVFEDDETGIITLYFSSDRVSPGKEHIYASTLQADETFGPPVLVTELSSSSRDVRPFVRKDGLELYFDSDRPGTAGLVDLYVSTRASTKVQWSLPVNLGLGINSTMVDARPVLSFDGTELYFHSNRDKVNVQDNDFYRCIRTKLRD